MRKLINYPKVVANFSLDKMNKGTFVAREGGYFLRTPLKGWNGYYDK